MLISRLTVIWRHGILCLRLALLSLWREPGLNSLRLLCMFLALLGPYSILLVQQSFKTTLTEQGKFQLGADLALSFDTQPEQTLLDKFLQELPKETIVKWGYNLVSMAEGQSSSGTTTSHLIEILALDHGLPFYINSQAPSPYPSLSSNTLALLDSEGQSLFQADDKTSNLFNLNLGNGTIVANGGDMPNVNLQFRFSGLGPRLITTTTVVKQLGLTEFGAQVQYILFAKMPAVNSTFVFVSGLREKLKGMIEKNALEGVSVYSFDRPSGRTQRAIDRTLAYLGLVALLSFLMGLVGSLYLTWSYWLRAQDQLALFKAIAPKGPQYIVFLQIVLLGLSAVLITIFSSLLAVLLLFKIWPQLSTQIPFVLEQVPNGATLLWTIVLGIIVPLLSCLPLISMAKHVAIASLLEDKGTNSMQQQKHWHFWLIPPVLLFGAYLFTKSWTASGLFVLVICLTLLIGPAISSLLINLLARLPLMQRGPLAWQLALRSMQRRPLLTGLVVLSMSLSFGVFHSIHQLQQAIVKDLLGGQPTSVNKSNKNVPTFFLMDIPAQYKKDLFDLANNNAAKVVDLSHHLRGRLTTINALPVGESKTIFFWQKSKEAEDRQRLQRHQLGLTFRLNLVEDEIILAGQPLDSLPENEIHASIEKRYAQRMGIKIGDVLEFDIFGSIVKARVANFRQVRWLNFRPNFFVVLSPAALGDLPFTYLGAIVVEDTKGIEHKQNFLKQLRKKIPGVSAIDIQRGLLQVNKLVSVITGLLRTLALFLPIGACLMLLGLAIYQRQEKKIDHHTLQLLGMNNSSRRWINLAQYAFIGPVSTLVAYLLGAGLLLTVMFLLVDLPIWAWAWSNILSLIIPYTLGLGFFL